MPELPNMKLRIAILVIFGFLLIISMVLIMHKGVPLTVRGNLLTVASGAPEGYLDGPNYAYVRTWFGTVRVKVGDMSDECSKGSVFPGLYGKHIIEGDFPVKVRAHFTGLHDANICGEGYYIERAN